MKELTLGNQNREQVEREAQILHEVDHPNIITFFEFHKEGYEAFIVMELAQRSLYDFLKSTMYPVPLVVVSSADQVHNELNFRSSGLSAFKANPAPRYQAKQHSDHQDRRGEAG